MTLDSNIMSFQAVLIHCPSITQMTFLCFLLHLVGISQPAAICYTDDTVNP